MKSEVIISYSSIQAVMTELAEGIGIIIYEPSLKENTFLNLPVEHNLQNLRKIDIVIANRVSPELNDIEDKVLTRDWDWIEKDHLC